MKQPIILLDFTKRQVREIDAAEMARRMIEQEKRGVLLTAAGSVRFRLAA